jgi:hypothetical protein
VIGREAMTHSLPEIWKQHLAELLEESEQAK